MLHLRTKDYTIACCVALRLDCSSFLVYIPLVHAQDLKEIISELAQLWPDCRMVHGRPRHSQSQGGIERLNRTVEEKLGAWMVENKSKRWSIGALFVKWYINNQFSRAIGTNPYKLAFGQNSRVGISSLSAACTRALGYFVDRVRSSTSVGSQC